MTVQIEEYRALLRELVNLQRKLIQVFEAEVRVVSSLPPIFPKDTQAKLEDLIKPERTISQILRAWPDDVGFVTLHLWVRPRMGVIQCEGQNWLFQLHGSIQVAFTGLPSELDIEVLESLKQGKSEVLTDLQGLGPIVDIRYIKDGRADGVSPWTVSLFAESVGSKASDLSTADHERLMEKLVKDKFLLPWPDYRVEGGSLLVLAPGSEVIDSS